jgi:hypothetical protein
MTFKSISKDHISALLCVSLGVGVVALGLTYGLGTLTEMGPGFVPVAIGVLLVVIGVAIGISGTRTSVRFIDAKRQKTENTPQWRGWLCIVGGLAAFIVLGTWGGLIPASFFTVFISALGDRNNTVKGAGILAVIMTVIVVLVFHYGLSLQMPLLRWG